MYLASIILLLLVLPVASIVIELVAHIAKDQRIAVLISAHEMNPLLPVMDRIVYMASGRAASGTTSEVVRPEVLSELYGQHVDVIHIHDRILVVAGRGNGPDIPVDGHTVDGHTVDGHTVDGHTVDGHAAGA